MGLVVLIAYTTFAGVQACLTKQAIKDNAESFEKTLYQMQAQTAAQEKAAGAAKSAADTAANQLNLAERPWVSAENISITSPLRFEPTKGGLMSIGYILRNTGRSPALHVMWQSRLIVLSHTKLMTEEISERQADLCNPLRKMASSLLDTTVFPGDTIPGEWPLSVNPAEIAAAMKSRETTPFKHSGYISVFIITCIDYQISILPQHHQTRYAFMIGIPMPSGPIMGDIKPEGTTPDLRLIYFSQSAD